MSEGTARESAVTQQITAAGMVAILRSATAEHYEAIAEVLVTSGVRVLEITLTAADALPAIARLAAGYADTDVVIGAGTVLSTDQAEACLEAGAAFLVSPAMTPDVLATARIAGVPAYPGALTPTEILTAHLSGASAVKLFPASAVTPRYLADVRAPLSGIAIMPTGGIGIDDIPAWMAAGAAAVGLGSPLIGAAAVAGPDSALADRARRAVDAVAQVRGERR